jgi:hypothetical protein
VEHSNFRLLKSSEGENAIQFCIAFIISLGTPFWIVYGTYGMTDLPIYLIKGKKSLE